MKKLLLTFTALTLTATTVHATNLNTQTDSLTLTLATLHTDPSSDHAASYSYTSLSEVVGEYWQTLRDLGYRGSLSKASASSTTYLFEGARGTLEATFTLRGNEVHTTVDRL